MEVELQVRVLSVPRRWWSAVSWMVLARADVCRVIAHGLEIHRAEVALRQAIAHPVLALLKAPPAGSSYPAGA
ncbi:MAG: hypothetical protein M3281_02025 [Chloroflexota bacterium]|nr:hypothetical protein [Chloroflexota bacterium]